MMAGVSDEFSLLHSYVISVSGGEGQTWKLPSDSLTVFVLAKLCPACVLLTLESSITPCQLWGCIEKAILLV